jgi:hypothetical protein
MPALLLPVLASASLMMSDAFQPSKDWFVLIRACDAHGVCEHFRQPIEVGNEVECQMTSFKWASQWQVEHPGYFLKSFNCVNFSQ